MGIIATATQAKRRQVAVEIFITVSISHALFVPHLSNGWEIGEWTLAKAGESKSGGGFIGPGKWCISKCRLQACKCAFQ